MLRVVRYRFLRRTDHSSTGVLPTVARRCVIKKPRTRGLQNRKPQWVVEPVEKKNLVPPQETRSVSVIKTSHLIAYIEIDVTSEIHINDINERYKV